MYNKKLSNNGFSMPIIILIAALTLSILGGGYYFFFYSKGIPISLSANNTINEETNIDCSKDSDVNGCESLKFVNNARKEKGLSPITKDETLCKLGKDISDSLVMGAISKQLDNLDTYFRNLINDKKYDYITRNQDRYRSQVSFFSEEPGGYKEAWKSTYREGLGRFDKGCVVYSEINNKGFWRVVLFVDSGTEK